MDTRTDFTPPVDWLNPLANWDAAARWNAMAFEWATKGWQQWMELATALSTGSPSLLSPVRGHDAMAAHPTARAEPEPAGPKRQARPKAAPGARPRSRG